MVGHVAVASINISPSFLALVKAPPMTRELSFSVEAGGLLRCKAVYWTDVRGETAEKEWEVHLPRTSHFYKLIIGDLT